MKKRYLAIAGLLVLAVAAAGCGKEKDKPAEQQVQATPTVTPQRDRGCRSCRYGSIR